MNPDETLKELLHDSRMLTATSSDPQVLALADRINDLHDHMMTGGYPPVAWRSAQELANDHVNHIQHEQLLLMAWVLMQQPDCELRMSYDELEALEGSHVQRADDHDKKQILFRLVTPTKPNLTIVETA